MNQYINKAVVVAEIDRVLNSYDPNQITSGRYALASLRDFLDTIEAKEVNLEKEYEEFVVDDPILGNFITNDTMGMEIAKHFFELGLKAKGE